MSEVPNITSKAMSILTEIDTGHRTLEQGDPELRIIVDEIERLECQKYVLTQEVTRLLKVENAVLSDLRSPFETSGESGKLERVSKAARELLEVLPVPNDHYGDEWAALEEALGDSPLKASAPLVESGPDDPPPRY